MLSNPPHNQNINSGFPNNHLGSKKLVIPPIRKYKFARTLTYLLLSRVQEIMDLRKKSLNYKKREKERKLVFQVSPIEAKAIFGFTRFCRTLLRDKNIRNLSLDFSK